MPVLGITGGIATGKTSFTQALSHKLRGHVFDADACARELLASDEGINQLVREAFGDAVFTLSGEVDRLKLREIVFDDESKRRALEAIVHPAVRSTWTRQAAKISREKEWLFVDIPLLFETAAEKLVDAVVVVACSAATQLRRLTTVRNIPEQMALKIIASQMPLQSKIEQAGHVIWNDGPPSCLERQTALLCAYLPARYG